MTRCLRILSMLALLSGCSGAELVNALVPEDGYRAVRDLAYGDGERQRLDLYLPVTKAAAAAGPASPPKSGPVPVVVYFHGGGWEAGSKADYPFVGEAFASRGYVTAIPDYRLYPQVRYPAFLEDGAAAVAALRRLLAAEGVAIGPVYLVGHSAGAWIAAMLTLDPHWLIRQGVAVCDTIAATAGLAGPYDFLPLQSATLKAIFGDPAPPESQPIAHAGGNAPPMLLITGARDDTIEPGNTQRLATRIRARGGRVETIVYDGVGHTMLAGALAQPLRALAPTLADVDAFLRRYPAVGGCGGQARRRHRV